MSGVLRRAGVDHPSCDVDCAPFYNNNTYLKVLRKSPGKNLSTNLVLALTPSPQYPNPHPKWEMELDGGPLFLALVPALFCGELVPGCGQM